MAEDQPLKFWKKHGRRKRREQAARNFANLSPGELREHKFLSFIVAVIVAFIIVGLIMWIAGLTAN